jgi:hypothetical protein
MAKSHQQEQGLHQDSIHKNVYLHILQLMKWTHNDMLTNQQQLGQLQKQKPSQEFGIRTRPN